MMYTTLDEERREIRLLQLLPGKDNDVLECRLFISAGRQEKYEALSYVWGDPTATETILVNGTRCHVGQNLMQALQHLRQAEHPRLLWVDALCINQNDIEERAKQVQIMGEIYGNAYRTVVWLGDFGSSGD